MKAFQEITEWNTDFAVPNHVYFLNDSRDKMYGYAPGGGLKVQRMTTPYRFHTRGRKFQEVKNTWRFTVQEEKPETCGIEHRVIGSRGDIYVVTDDRGVWSCTCPASKWQKGECKHILSIKVK